MVALVKQGIAYRVQNDGETSAHEEILVPKTVKDLLRFWYEHVDQIDNALTIGDLVTMLAGIADPDDLLSDLLQSNIPRLLALAKEPPTQSDIPTNAGIVVGFHCLLNGYPFAAPTPSGEAYGLSIFCSADATTKTDMRILPYERSCKLFADVRRINNMMQATIDFQQLTSFPSGKASGESIAEYYMFASLGEFLGAIFRHFLLPEDAEKLMDALLV